MNKTLPHRWMPSLFLTLAVLTGCGGGGDALTEAQPEIALAGAPAFAYRGDTLHLVAALSDSNAAGTIDVFFVDEGQTTAISHVQSQPFQWTTTIPVAASGRVSYYATLCDSSGRCMSSAPVMIDIYTRASSEELRR